MDGSLALVIAESRPLLILGDSGGIAQTGQPILESQAQLTCQATVFSCGNFPHLGYDVAVDPYRFSLWA